MSEEIKKIVKIPSSGYRIFLIVWISVWLTIDLFYSAFLALGASVQGSNLSVGSVVANIISTILGVVLASILIFFLITINSKVNAKEVAPYISGVTILGGFYFFQRNLVSLVVQISEALSGDQSTVSLKIAGIMLLVLGWLIPSVMIYIFTILDMGKLKTYNKALTA